MHDDPDIHEWEALLELRETGVDVSEALGAMQDRRAAREAEFQALVGPMMASAGVAVTWRADAEDLASRLATARRLKFGGMDPITGAVVLQRDGVTEIFYPGGGGDIIED